MANEKEDIVDIELCIQQTIFFYSEIRRLAKVSTLNYRKFYSLLQKMSKIILDEMIELKTERLELSELEENISVKASKRAAVLEAKNLFRIIFLIQLYLKQLNFGTGREENIPVEFIFPLENIISGIEEKNLIFLVASWELNYSIVDFTNVLFDLFETDPLLLRFLNNKEYDFHIIIIKLPYSWKEAALMYPLLFHEIGHLLAKRTASNLEKDFKMLISLKSLERAFNAIESNLDNSLANERPKDLLYYDKLRRIQEHIIVTSLSWYSEIQCDLFGVTMMNLGFVFAFTSFFRPSIKKTTCGSSHPPSFLRYNFLYHKLKKMKMLEKLESVSPDVLFILKDSEDNWTDYVSQTQEPYRACIEVIENYKNTLLQSDFLKDQNLKLKEFKYNHSKYETYGKELFRLILNFIPINELIINEKESFQCNLALIINTGWFFFQDETYYSKFLDKTKSKEKFFSSRYSRSFGPVISQIHKDKEIPILQKIYEIERSDFSNNYDDEEFDPFLTLNRLIYKSIELSFIQDYLKNIRESESVSINKRKNK